MKKKAILEKASDIICGEREKDYGDSNSSLDYTAVAWSAYLSACMGKDIEIAASDVACMMIMLKCIRQCHGEGVIDNWIDMAGYAAIGGEAWSRYGTVHLDEGK